ncbi:MAG: single-stranded-DNA-specific exonuclease RecJ [Rickettsiales bacterium]
MTVAEQTSSITSLTDSQWLLREADERQVMAIMQRHHLPEVLARILTVRGVGLDEVDDFMNPSLKASMPDPSHLLDMDVAAERIASAVMAGERIGIFGDYDVDGATSSALLMRYFRALGTDPLVHIPDRMVEGYGPNAPALLGLKEKGAALVITVDCGTLAFEPLEAAHEAGLDMIVVDHHQGEARKPKCLALVNPNRIDETSTHGQLAAVGVAFLLCVAVNRKLRETGFFADKAEPDLRGWLDIVALGTVCDVVPLTGLNRALVAQGLKVIAGRGNLGMRTLMDSAGVDSKPSTYTCGFVMGPRINAGGRVGKSDLGVRLLTTENDAEAKQLAAELEQYNAERKAIEATVLEEAMAQAEAAADSPMLTIAGKGWHPGVIGIVASRVKERFNVPTAIVALDDGVGKASARSVSGVDLGAAVIAAMDSGLLVAGGGHAMAAGFTVEEDKLPALSEFLNEHVARQSEGLSKQKCYKLDGTISIAGATVDLVEKLERLGPFGQGNPSVRIAVQKVVNLKPEIVGEHHVRTIFIDKLSNARLTGIAFRAVDGPLGEALLSTRGKEVQVAGQLKLNEWNGRTSVQIHIDDIA